MPRLDYRLSLLMIASALVLAGCSHMPGKAQSKNGGGTSAANSKSAVAGAIASAAQDAADEGNNADALAFQQKLYNGDPRNPDYILSYARALRRSGRIDDALLVIRTPAKGKRATEPLMTECALVLIAAGKYDEALEFAQGALEKNDKSANAHQALALALSGLHKDADAQLQFERALELWPEDRDKTPIINNLAMSLAAQGKVSEARSVMSQATGEALKSAVYQNNRALLDTLKDRDIRAEKVDVKGTTQVTSVSPRAPKKTGFKPRGKMAPIVE